MSHDDHHHHHHSCCSHESEEYDCCHQDECCEHHHHHHHEDFSQQLFDLADAAWTELLKEKIKEQIKANNGKRLDELAKLVSESNDMRWKHKLGGNAVSQHFHDKINNFFNRE